MSSSNGVVRIGRKGTKKFAFGEDGPVFELDVVVAFQRWIEVDSTFRPEDTDTGGSRDIAAADMPAYHQAAVHFAKECVGDMDAPVTTAEALDFIARLREQYDDLVTFFRPRSSEERASPATSEVGSELRFSVEN